MSLVRQENALSKVFPLNNSITRYCCVVIFVHMNFWMIWYQYRSCPPPLSHKQCMSTFLSENPLQTLFMKRSKVSKLNAIWTNCECSNDALMSNDSLRNLWLTIFDDLSTSGLYGQQSVWTVSECDNIDTWVTLADRLGGEEDSLIVGCLGERGAGVCWGHPDQKLGKLEKYIKQNLS